MRVIWLLLLLSTPAWSKVLVERLPQGGLQPQAASDEHGTMHLIYLSGDPGSSDIWYVRKEPGGKAFSKPLRVNSQPGSAMAIGTIRGAKLALGRGGRVHVLWNGSAKALPKGPKEATPLLYTRLDPARGGFEAQRNVISKAYGLDGGGSIAADLQGRVYATWTAGGAGVKEADRKVWVAASMDDGASFAAETLASQAYGACGCCGMGAATDAQGKLYVLYRAAVKGSERGMHLLASKDAGRSFSEEGLDHWPLEGCPMTMASFSSGSSFFGAWERDGKVFARDLASLKQPAWSPSDQAEAKFPVLAQKRGRVLLAWAEGTGWNKGGSVAWQEFDPKGKSLADKMVSKDLPAWSLPAVLAGPGDDFTVIY